MLRARSAPTARDALLGVAQQRGAAQRPVVRLLQRLQQQREDVGEVGAVRLLVDGAVVERRRRASLAVDREDVHDGQHRVEDLRRRLDETHALTVPAGAVQVEAVYVDAWRAEPTLLVRGDEQHAWWTNTTLRRGSTRRILLRSQPAPSR